VKSRILFAIAAFLFVVGVLPIAAQPSSTGTNRRIGVEEFEKLRARTNIVVLDVRTAAEFAKGRIPGSTNIDFNSLRFTEKIAALDKSKTYVVTCAVGMRSARACKKLEALGFKEWYDLAPGFDGWKKAGKPVEK
jgi:phage shock protein E